jgi:hypothetical protein
MEIGAAPNGAALFFVRSPGSSPAAGGPYEPNGQLLTVRTTRWTALDVPLYATCRPAETRWQLALVSIMEFAERLSDRRAADAVRGTIDWKYSSACHSMIPVSMPPCRVSSALDDWQARPSRLCGYCAHCLP